MKNILVSEIFGPTLQGEGALIGRPTVFVRTGGCDYRCSWCDTLYAVLPQYRDEWQPMSPQAILDEVLTLSQGHPILVTISGGNPALQPLENLISLGRRHELTFALETQGSVAKPWFADLDYLILSPKPPSSEMSTNWDDVKACVAVAETTHVALKIVIFDEADYEFAREAAAILPRVPLYLQVGTPTGDRSTPVAPDMSCLVERTEWLLGRVTQDGWNNVTVLPQMHVLLWGNKRGV